MKEIEANAIGILIVEDDRSVAEVLRDQITRENVNVEVCSNGAEATDTMDKQVFDLVITDLMMPKIGGIGVLRHARMINPDVIVIIITGYASLETAIEAIREGAYDYIRKPFKLQELQIVVNNAIDKIGLIRENKKLLKELDDVYRQLIVIKNEQETACHTTPQREEKGQWSLAFYSSNAPFLHYTPRSRDGGKNYFDALERLSALKQKGLLTDNEFKTFKEYLLKAIKHPDPV
jgi:CheY-like chemotaxis protein